MAKLRNHPNILRLHAMAFAGSPGMTRKPLLKDEKWQNRSFLLSVSSASFA